jgi:hypothetical protein
MRRGMDIGCWWEGQKERVDNIKMDLREREREDEAVLIGLIWLRIGTSGWLL